MNQMAEESELKPWMLELFQDRSFFQQQFSCSQSNTNSER